jgi:hypothetical protein
MRNKSDKHSSTIPDVLVVAGAEDAFALEIRAEIARRGRSVAMLDGPSAARLFTIRVKSAGIQVSPAMPMFMRASAWTSSFTEVDDADRRFLTDEAFATLWAAAYSMPACVINRPSSKGSIGRLTSSYFTGGPENFVGSEEFYASGPELLRNLKGSIWGEDTDFRSAELSALRPDRPVRARIINDLAEYEIVTVVGNESFCATADTRSEKANLREKSVAIARSLKIHFAAVTWALAEDMAAPVRLNAEPGLAELRTCFVEARASIVRDLLS